jgi:hypothetical protein
LYIGTDVGVYVSTDAGQSWTILGTGLPRVAVVDLAFASDGKLLAATHGRGVWLHTTRIIVTFAEEPNAVSLTIDGVVYTGGQLLSDYFEWDNGSTHMMQTTSTLESQEGVRYAFLAWSGGSTDLTRTITITQHGDYSALFKTQYQLKVISDLGNPQGEGWYDTGSTATFSVTSPSPSSGLFGLLGGRAIFQKWTGSSTSNSPASTITMNGPRAVQAVWIIDNSPAYVTVAIIVAAVIVAVMVVMVKRRRSQKRTVPQATVTCPKCGTQLPPNSGFCYTCGSSLSAMSSHPNE